MVGPGATAQALVSSTAVDRARQAADSAAGRADVVIGAVEDEGVLQEAVELLCAVCAVDEVAQVLFGLDGLGVLGAVIDPLDGELGVLVETIAPVRAVPTCGVVGQIKERPGEGA